MPEDLRVTPPAPNTSASTSPDVTPLDWRVLVNEALRRRKAEGLTQKQHAALAGVSVPTMVAFDRGETTLSLAKAFDILDVVGLVAKAPPEGSQARFVRDAMERWRTLVEQEPAGSPARFEHGSLRIDYWLEGGLKAVDVNDLRQILINNEFAATPSSLFLPSGLPIHVPQIIQNNVECWLKPIKTHQAFRDGPEKCEFWRASPAGRVLLMRGYREDGSTTFDAGRIFDTTIPIWRITDALIHAAWMTQVIAKNPSGITIHVNVTCTGLRGRILKSWINPLKEVSGEGQEATRDEAHASTATDIATINNHPEKIITPMIDDIWQSFGAEARSKLLVGQEIQRYTLRTS